MSESAKTIQTTANISTTLALIVTLIVFVSEVNSSRRDREYQSFLTMLDNYQQIVEERKTEWGKIGDVVKKDPKISHEMHDRQTSIGYLLLRLEQPEPMYAIELGLLDSELRSLNFLDKLCEIAEKNDRALEILLLTDSQEIWFYQSQMDNLLKLYESQKSVRRFPKPRYKSLQKCDVSEFFG